MSTQSTLIFVYGTLKQGFPNHHLIQTLTPTNDAVFLGKYITCKPYPLVCGPLGIPFLINLPGSGKRVRGELYSVSGRALALLDELEGVSRAHYERLPIEVEAEAEVVHAEGYFGHRTFGVELWERSGGDGLEEYEDRDGEMYVRVEDRDVGLNLRDYVRLYLQQQNQEVGHAGST